MRISSGIFKGKTIIVPRSGVIPTSDKVRQALMNILQGSIRGARFLDLCSGTGAVGIEALSQGASFCCFVENADRMYSILKKNLEAIVPDKNLYKTIRHNVAHITPEVIGPELLPFDVVFADPFYKDTRFTVDGFFPVVFSLLRGGGTFILEHSDKEDYSRYANFESRRDYGDTVLSIFKKKSSADTDKGLAEGA